MIHIKKFIDKVSSMDSRSSRDLVLPATEARALRDELAKLLVDRFEAAAAAAVSKPTVADSIIELQISGGKW
jgi:hypothetical protein